MNKPTSARDEADLLKRRKALATFLRCSCISCMDTVEHLFKVDEERAERRGVVKGLRMAADIIWQLSLDNK